MKKSTANKVTACTLCALLSSCMIPAAAFAQEEGETSHAQKTQVVYVNADIDGSNRGVYVVNRFDGATGGVVRDTADYTEVRNLTDAQELRAQGTNSIEVAKGEPFLYQGNLAAETELPWTVTAHYTLNGREVDASQLGGAAGEVQLTVEIEPNGEFSREGDFADSYLLQVSGSLDNDCFHGISAPDASVAQVGDATQFTYMVLPGESVSYTVTAQTDEFSFAGWQIVGVPLSLVIELSDDDLDADSGLDDVSYATAELADGAVEVSDGIAELHAGMGEVSGATGLLSGGLSALESQGGELATGASAMQEGLDEAAAGILQLDAAVNGQLVPGAEALVQGSSAYADGLSAQIKALEGQAASVDVATAQAAYEAAQQEYVLAYGAALAQALTSGMSEQEAIGSALSATAGQQQALEQALAGFVSAQAAQTGASSGAQALEGALSGYADLDAGIATLVDQSSPASVYALGAAIQQAGSGVAQLAEGADALAQGADAYHDGVSEAASGADLLAESTLQAEQGAGRLSEGAAGLSAGSTELATATASLNDDVMEAVQDKLTDYLNPQSVPTDFVTGQTEDVASVQFVIATRSIDAPEQEVEASEEQPEKNMLEKFLDLFL